MTIWKRENEFLFRVVGFKSLVWLSPNISLSSVLRTQLNSRHCWARGAVQMHTGPSLFPNTFIKKISNQDCRDKRYPSFIHWQKLTVSWPGPSSLDSRKIKSFPWWPSPKACFSFVQCSWRCLSFSFGYRGSLTFLISPYSPIQK